MKGPKQSSKQKKLLEIQVKIIKFCKFIFLLRKIIEMCNDRGKFIIYFEGWMNFLYLIFIRYRDEFCGW